jgi:SAM-dependent methyltransferase
MTTTSTGDEVRRIYDALAEHYLMVYPTLDADASDDVRLLLAHASTDAPIRRVLDCGCGIGFVVKALRGLSYEASGIDISERQVALAHRLHADVAEHLAVCDWSSLRERFALNSFDLVMCAGPAIYHTPEPELASVLGQMVAVTVPGGNVAVETIRDYSEHVPGKFDVKARGCVIDAATGVIHVSLFLDTWTGNGVFERLVRVLRYRGPSDRPESVHDFPLVRIFAITPKMIAKTLTALGCDVVSTYRSGRASDTVVARKPTCGTTTPLPTSEANEPG